jgi:cytochrome d ubiquinol oxidase subunit II
MAPVWEANHVWLLFVLTVFWTAYPGAFAPVVVALTVPLFLAGVGIVLRGIAYALHSGAARDRERRLIDTVFGASSVLTPFALGLAVGGLASGRIPADDGGRALVTSWVNPTSVAVALLAVAISAYLAAVYLAADAARIGDADLIRRFRRRALGAGLVGGGLALGALAVLRTEAPGLFAGLTRGPGLAGLLVSATAGVATLALVWAGRYGVARPASALAVAAILGGWALAQGPVLLPGLTVEAAAAPRPTLASLVVAVAVGAVLLAPMLLLLFRLALRGRFDEPRARPADPPD